MASNWNGKQKTRLKKSQSPEFAPKKYTSKKQKGIRSKPHIEDATEERRHEQLVVGDGKGQVVESILVSKQGGLSVQGVAYAVE